MSEKPLWKSAGEQAAFQRLKDIERAVTQLGLEDTHEALSALTQRRAQKGSWDWGLFEDGVNSLLLEYGQQDPTYAAGLRLMEDVLEKIFALKRGKGKLFDLLGPEWTVDETQLDASLGVVTRAIEGVRDPRTAILLLGLGHIIRYETKGDIVRNRLGYWAGVLNFSRGTREQLAEDFLTIRQKGLDGKADTTHVRNAFAHAHFQFQDESCVELWDTRLASKKETYRATLTGADLRNLSNLFEKKLVLAEIYPSLLVAIEDLFQAYKKEWRGFRRSPT